MSKLRKKKLTSKSNPQALLNFKLQQMNPSLPRLKIRIMQAFTRSLFLQFLPASMHSLPKSPTTCESRQEIKTTGTGRTDQCNNLEEFHRAINKPPQLSKSQLWSALQKNAKKETRLMPGNKEKKMKNIASSLKTSSKKASNCLCRMEHRKRQIEAKRKIDHWLVDLSQVILLNNSKGHHQSRQR